MRLWATHFASLSLSFPVYTNYGCPSSPPLQSLPSPRSKESSWVWGVPGLLKQSYVPGPLQSGSPQPSASLVCRATPGLVGSWEVSNFSKNISADASEKGETWALQRVRSLERCHLVLPIPTPTRQTLSPECKVLMIPQWRGSPPLWCDRDSTEMSKDTVLGTVWMMLMSEMRQLSHLWGHRGPHLGVPLCLRGTPFTTSCSSLPRSLSSPLLQRCYSVPGHQLMKMRSSQFYEQTPLGTFLTVQWLGLHTSTVGGKVLSRGWGTKNEPKN